MKKLLASMILSAALAGCGAVSNDGTDPTPTPTPTPGLTIADIQQGNVTPETAVEIEGVIVTAVDPFNSNVDFYGQDAGGGEYSGMYFFDGDAVVPAELAVGDEVTVSGTYTEYQGPTSDPWNETISEIRVTEVTITQTGLVPTATLIAAADLGEELTGNASEPWEFCLIEIDGDVNVLNAALGFGEFSVGNGQPGEQIRVDDQIYGDAEQGRYNGQLLTTLVGIWSYSFDEYKLEPRSAADVVGEELGPINSTVALIQDTSAAGRPVIGQQVILDDVHVTAAWSASNNRRQLFIADANVPAIYQGILVFQENGGSTLVPANITTGFTLDITGVYEEFNGMAEVVLNTSEQASVTVVTSVPAVMAPMQVTMAQLLANPEQYEGLLIELMNGPFTVTAIGLPGSQIRIRDASNDQFLFDDFIWAAADVSYPVDSTMSSVRGVIRHSQGATFNDYQIVPRSPLDVTTP